MGASDFHQLIKRGWQCLTREQFSGLYDKAERYIFEGDIVRLWKNKRPTKWLLQCFFDEDFACFDFRYLDGDHFDPNFEEFRTLKKEARQTFELVGNIHGTPELLPN